MGQLLTTKAAIDAFVGTKHHFSDGVYAKEMHLPAGGYAKSHKHAYTHLSILAEGNVIVTVDGEDCIYDAPVCIEIQAGKEHEIHAVTNSTWFCIHATDVCDPNKVDEVLIAHD